ncbi:MAG: hypothetical protein EPN26_01235, partial [Rhodospirillales bacterium]
MPYQRYIHAVLILASVCLAVVGAVNLRVDPLGLFSWDSAFAEDLARAALEGKDMAIEGGNLEDRRLTISLLRDKNYPFDVVSVGSSRTMQLRENSFPFAKFYNHALWGSIIVDYLGVKYLLGERNVPPRMVVIGADPWIFNAHARQIRWWPLFPQAQRELAHLSPRLDWQTHLRLQARYFLDYQKILVEKLTQLFSYPYLKRSYEKIVECRCLEGASLKAGETSNDLSPSLIKRHDGSVANPIAARVRPAAEVRQEAEGFARSPNFYSYENYSRMDPDLQELFEALVADLRASGTEIVILLAPFHPIAYDGMMHRADGRITA